MYFKRNKFMHSKGLQKILLLYYIVFEELRNVICKFLMDSIILVSEELRKPKYLSIMNSGRIH
jgi:hypothetical protein